MQEIKGYDRCVHDLLGGSHFGIDYYQREYKWGTKQLSELINDLTSRFQENYSEGDTPKAVAQYGHYFLGSIVVSKGGETNQVVDGQQRLTTLTLLLIYLNNLQKEADKPVDIKNLIYDDDFGEMTFKLSIPERNSCMAALFNQTLFDPEGKSESVQNLYARYSDLDELFPDELKGELLPLFVYWLIKKVQLVEITAYADEDAYTIFETMNDRGLSLSPTDMLKGYLLANIDNPEKRLEADKLIKKWLLTFADYGKDTESDFFKAWLRAQYARKIRERKAQARPEDFDLIGTEYHRWVRNNRQVIGLENSDDYHCWITHDLDYFAQLFIKLLKASAERTPGLESVRYNADAGFTQQLQLLLAPVVASEGMALSLQKAGVVANFLDCWLNRRLWNFKSNSYSSMQYTIFVLGKEMRGKPLAELRDYLAERLQAEDKALDFTEPTYLNQWSAKSLHRQLARFTDWLEQQTGLPGRYPEYIQRSGKHAYEIEHIWANHYQRHSDEFPQQKEFDDWRNTIGGLLLLPKKVNASLNDMTYQDKLPHYIKENLLAQSLHSLAYQNHPGFKQAMTEHGLLFKHHPEFKKADLEARNALYCQLANAVWSVGRLKGEVA
ncbi:DUF262 domain-containing protein [Sedimenticola hydrogenitrophicus]|uniref:DUF262 domain-containing protein n=1 Tax=Sedimenticola hydrogenitrophicus TaxID=2967975 RepID=UPI0023B02044|nr:DUF262 domain-containing protein [Sedimenticola hydrogenitrophicus]